MTLLIVHPLRPIPWERPGVFVDPHRRLVFCARRENGPAQQYGVPTENLIRRFQHGQPRAFEALYDRYKDMVYRTAFFITRDSAEAKEVVQETFLDVLRALPHYQVEGLAKFETWLYRVTVNRCRMRLSDAITTEVTVEPAGP